MNPLKKKREITYYLIACRCILPFFFILLPFLLSAQITDDFTDGNFTLHPPWKGNDTDFVVNPDHQLQHSSSGTGTSYLSTDNIQPLNNCEWSFFIHLNFSPSSSNYARIYLVSNHPDISKNLNGYYLQFGESLNNDRVELFRQSGTGSISVCRGTTLIANAFSIRVKVTRDDRGLWKLFIDPAGGTDYTLEANGTDNVYTIASYFGVYCKYTTANAANFFFDDFYIYAPPDLTPPALDSVKIISQNKIDAYFSEELKILSAQTPGNYFVNKELAFAKSAALDTLNPALVHLTFEKGFLNGQLYTLSVTGVQDQAGNTTLHATNNFLFFMPQANDIVINEIMADVSPAPDSLPPYEYLELFNRTNYTAELKGWKLSDATSSVTIPDIAIAPNGFYVLTSLPAVSAFGSSIPVAGVPGFPSLNDTGDDLILRDANGNIISLAFYRASWYNDPLKNSGGWSLEQIDPNSSCSGKPNWKASADNSGGTPGRENSVYASVPDITPPTLSRAIILSSNSIQLFFDEYMDSIPLTMLSSYIVDKGLGSPTHANPVGPDYSSVVLTFPSSIAPGTIYTVTVNSLKDCAGNMIASGHSTAFAIPESVVQNDIVINEVMFDPKDQGLEWIEIYNRSNKIIDLKEIFLCSQDNHGNFTEINQVAPKGYLLLPENYLVLSTDASIVKAQYYTENSNGFMDMKSIPSLHNDSDYVILLNISQKVIDKLKYHAAWHLPLLNYTKGISLERVNFDHTTQDENNWHSASESVGGATPAYQNSQYTHGENGAEITISPEVFSPDNDGYNDVLSISYSLDAPGMVGNLNIYDSRGGLMRSLVRNELLGTSGTFFWDGMTNDRIKARIGIYVLYFEAFDTHGRVRKYKKACVVGGKL